MPDNNNEAKRRPLRSRDEIWLPASERAKREGTNISRVINDFLLDYGRPGFGVDQTTLAEKLSAVIEDEFVDMEEQDVAYFVELILRVFEKEKRLAIAAGNA